ncbi:MAG: hypothetical protein KJ626_03670 [Verrucomicrobia bacterium]|nr:hypothetical protein [Verrucomicrobiota bacterium]
MKTTRHKRSVTIRSVSVYRRLFLLLLPLMVVISSITATEGHAAVINGSFESATGNNPDDWTEFGNAYSESDPNAQDGSRSAKLFQNFTGAPNLTGAFQDQAVTVGQNYTLSGYLRNGDGAGGDYLQADNEAFLKIQWLNGSYVEVGAYEYAPYNGGGIDSSTAQDDQWIYNTLTQTAPAGAVYGRVTLIHNYKGSDYLGGSSWFDSVTFEAEGGGGPAGAAPEPGTAALILVAGIGLFGRHRGSLKRLINSLS